MSTQTLHIRNYNAEVCLCSWVSDLPNRFREDVDLQVHDLHSGRFQPALVQLCTNTYLMALREILQGVKRRLAQDLLLSISELELTLYDLSGENTDGMVYNWTPVSLIAQKGQ